jgi:hypothetical protein
VFFSPERGAVMIVVELQFRDRNRPSNLFKIARTELTAPTVIEDKEGNFFIKCPIDPRIVVGSVDCPLQYRQCRGEVLSNILVVRSLSEEVV